MDVCGRRKISHVRISPFRNNKAIKEANDEFSLREKFSRKTAVQQMLYLTLFIHIHF